ncbi:hypothetical protein DSM25559_3472 [Agrobacterium rosae]|uniref:Uncharacterized protein n=1 Tax=Agrobacterium rosae TaxID=1972867 RepID=A0A1R3U1Z7_9HYPH|nr:hypothetical protein DSM25559_3472 [Agrobacterium rosae]
MADGGQGSIDVRDRLGIWPHRTLDHQHPYAQPTRRLNLRIGRRAAGVFGDDERDVIFTQQVDFISQCEGPTRRKVKGMRYRQRWLNRVDATDEVMVLRRGLEGQQFLTTEREESGGACVSKSSNSAFHIGHALPVIASLSLPRRALQSDKRNIRYFCGLNGVCRDAGRVRVGRVHQKIEPVFRHEVGQSTCTAKAAGAHRHRLLNRVTGAACHRQKQPVAGIFRQFSSQNTGIRRATENEYGACHGL